MGRAKKKFLSLIALVLWVAALTFQQAAVAGRGGPSGLEVQGVLPNSSGENLGFVVGINEESRRMYYMNRQGPSFFLREYDLRTETPRQVREELMGVWENLRINYTSPYTMQIDQKRNVMVILSQTGYGSSLKFVDLKTFKFIGEWDVGTVLPGFVGQGLRISERDNRIYLVGSQSVNGGVSDSRAFQKPAQVVVVAALDAKVGIDESPKLAWARPVPQCQQVMDTAAVGALLARSEKLSALYFACIRGYSYPGESGLVRLWIDKKADQSQATEFPVDFFPVSGAFTIPAEGIVGMSAFDPVRERFFVQSLSQGTPGTWVFDGNISAWVGFIVSPDNSNRYFGIDTKSGHYYMGGQIGPDRSGYIVVSDTSQTPVTQGEVVSGVKMRGFISVDEKTHRLFAKVDLKEMGLWNGDPKALAKEGFVVVRDHTKIAQPQKPVDYDELTRDVKEGPGVATSFSGGVNGYGARALLVGGYGGAISATGQRPTIGSFRPGDRGLTFARVPSVDIRSAGASASAQSLVPDSNTEGDLDDAGAGAWPWTPATCLDGGGSAQTNQGEGPNSTAIVTCDLDKNKAEASSSWGAVTADGLAIAESSFVARARRDAKLGAVTETVAQTRGIEVSLPNGGTLSISRVWASSITAAHGLTGSAQARYERKISGIQVTDAEGTVVHSTAECGGKKDVSCHDAIAELNRLLPMKIHIGLPDPVVAKTPKGAFAGVFLSDGAFIEARTMNNHGSTFKAESGSRAVPALQISIYNDSEEKSRLVAQLAAIEANSIYTNTPITEQDIPQIDVPAPATNTGAGATTSGPTLSSAPPSGSVGIGDTPVAASQPIATTPVASAPLKGVLAFLSRSPGSAVLVATVWMTFLSAGVAVLRRRSLLALLLDGAGS